MVYQEQIMQTAQIIGGFSLGGADLLRRAMGKKKMDVMQQQKVVFAEGAHKLHGIEEAKSNEIFEVMEKFAEYGFNRSHSAAYSVVAYQTGYLKAHYPAEFMAAVLTNNMNDIKKVTFFMEECRRMGMPVLGPDVNESNYRFTVNEKGEIRFGIGAVKGVGEGAVEAIINERKENGKYHSVFDFTKRVDLRACNKRALESLALAGGFDSFENTHRAQYFFEENNTTFLEKAIKYGATHQASMNSSQVSLFGEQSEVSIPEPSLPICEEWGTLEKLSKERDMVGVFISGHPLDDYKLEIKQFCTRGFHLGLMDNMEALMGKELKFAAVVSEANHLTTKKGKPWGKVKLEDYQGDTELFLFGDDYLSNQQFLTPNYFLFVRGKVVMSRFRNEPEFKISKVNLLSDLRENIAKELKISMELNSVTDELIDELDSIIHENEGNCRVFMHFNHAGEKIDAKGMLKGKKVAISDNLIDRLEKLDLSFAMS
jgi:DNA polymerase-3 subunit alpha